MILGSTDSYYVSYVLISKRHGARKRCVDI